MNDSPVLVSIIIPNYNHSKFIEDRIESILNQTYTCVEIIILDDHSTDNSQEIIEKYRDCSNIKCIVFNETNSGSVFKQWKRGLQYAKGELVWIAESDDLCKENFLEQIIPVFEDDEVVLAYTRSIDIDETGRPIGLSYMQYEWCNYSFVKQGSQEIKDHLLYQCTIPNVSAVVFRNEVFEKSHLDHNFKLCGDWYFYSQILEKGKIAYLSDPLSFHRFHSGSVRSKSRRSLSILEERLKIVNIIAQGKSVTLKNYIKAIRMQIEFYVNEVTLRDILGRKVWGLFKVVNKYNRYFVPFLPLIILKRICKRIFRSNYHLLSKDLR